MADNIESSTAEETTATKPREVPAPELTYHSIQSACRAIASHYNKSFDKIHLVWPMQFVDGAVVDFVDASNKFIASARLRFGNKIYVHDTTGGISLDIHLSDLAYGRTAHTITAASSDEANKKA